MNTVMTIFKFSIYIQANSIHSTPKTTNHCDIITEAFFTMTSSCNLVILKYLQLPHIFKDLGTAFASISCKTKPQNSVHSSQGILLYVYLL